MDTAIFKGISFGLTSGVITTLGLLVGLSASTGSKSVVIGGIISIAVADSFSDALGIHVSEESEQEHTEKEIWTSTIFTFLSKFLFALTFIIPVIFLSLTLATGVSIVWGLLVLGLLSFFIAREGKESTIKAMAEHLSIAVLVIIITYFVGTWVSTIFG